MTSASWRMTDCCSTWRGRNRDGCGSATAKEAAKRSGGDQRVKGDFGRAEKAERHAHGAQARVHIEVEVTDAMVTPNVFVAEVRCLDSTEPGRADLTAVGVTGELHNSELLIGKAIGRIRFVKEDDVGLGRVPMAQRGPRVGAACPG